MLVIDACHILSCLHDLPSLVALACFEARIGVLCILAVPLYALVRSMAPHLNPRARSSEAALREATCLALLR